MNKLVTHDIVDMAVEEYDAALKTGKPPIRAALEAAAPLIAEMVKERSNNKEAQRIQELEAKVKRLREALAPFAAVADEFEGRIGIGLHSEDAALWKPQSSTRETSGIYIRHIVRARNTLQDDK